MLAAPQAQFDPTFPGLFAADPLDIVAEADLSDVLPEIAVPTLLIWGPSDARSPLNVVH